MSKPFRCFLRAYTNSNQVRFTVKPYTTTTKTMSQAKVELEGSEAPPYTASLESQKWDIREKQASVFSQVALRFPAAVLEMIATER